MGLIARTRGASYGPATNRDSERTTMAVVAEANDDADRFLRMIASGRPLSGSVMQAAENTGAIPQRAGGMHATAKLLPFDGDAYAVFAFIETAILVNEAQGSERLSYTQRAMINPTVRVATSELIAAEDSAVWQYAADSTSAAIEPDQRAMASVKAAYHRNRREAFLKIGETLEDYITVAT